MLQQIDIKVREIVPFYYLPNSAITFSQTAYLNTSHIDTRKITWNSLQLNTILINCRTSLF